MFLWDLLQVLKNNIMIKCYFVFLLINLAVQQCFPIEILAQTSQFSKNSLIAPKNKLTKAVQTLPEDFLMSVLKADYKKPGWNEYIPKDGVPVLDLPLPTMTSRPRFINERDINNAVSKLNTMPYSDWYSKLKREVQRNNLNNNLPLFYTTNRLKMLAFLYKLDGNVEYLVEFESLLKTIPEPPEILNIQGGKQHDDWGEYLESAQALATLCPALDLVYNDINPNLLEDTRRKMLIVTGQLQEALLFTPANNHLILISIAFMEMAIFEDHPQDYIPYNRVEIWNSGLKNLARGLGRVAPDGGYAEGTSYAHFVLGYLAPLSVYLNNIFSINIMNYPRLERLVDWIIANDKGNEHYNAIDDALQPNDFFMPLIITNSRQAPYWNYYYQSQPFSYRVYSNMVEAILDYHPTASFLPPYIPKDSFFPESGQAVFKDQKVNPAIYGSFIAERERWFADRHEHIDPLSFELSAFGKDFIVEGGYGQWVNDFDRSAWYTSPYAHNGILIDGLGVYSNPIWGDSSGADIQDMYYSEKNASATLRHKINQVNVERKIFFINRRFFLMLDNFDGYMQHDFAINLNYQGDFKQLFKNQYQISNDDIDLNIVHISDNSLAPLITHNFGLKTPPIPAQPIKSVQIEHLNVTDGSLMTVLYPAKNYEPVNFQERPINDHSKLIEINDSEFQGITQLLKNNNEIIKTELWQTDAKILLYQDNLNGEKTIYLENFTTFSQANLKISSPIPINLYIEYSKGSWYGYIYKPHNYKYTIHFEGLFEGPIRFNHKLVLSNLTQGNSANSYTIELEGSGILETGHTYNQIMPVYRYHDENNFLYWLRNRPTLLQNSQYWNDSEKQIFKNQIMRNTIAAIDEAGQKKSEDIFGNPMIFDYVANSTGLFQETFADKTSSSFDIAQRFSKTIAFSGWNTSLLEDGSFTEKGIRLRNLNLKSKNPQGKGIDYRYRHFFEDQESHSIRLHQNNRNYAFYSLSKSREDNLQQVNLNYDNNEIGVNPGFLWYDRSKVNQLFVNSYINNFSTSFTTLHQKNGEIKYNESLSGYWNAFSFNLQGSQEKDEKYSGSFFSRPLTNTSFSQNIILQKSESNIWKIPFGQVNASASVDNQFFFTRQDFIEKYTRQYFYYALNQQNTRFDLLFTMKNYRPSAFEQTKINYQKVFKNNLSYNVLVDFQKSEWQLTQRMDIPLDSKTYIYPVVSINRDFPEKISSYGSGFFRYGRIPIFSQIRIYNDNDLVEFQSSLYSLRLTSSLEFELWMQALSRENKLEQLSFELKNTNHFTQPGLYYSYSKYAGIRWEGFLLFIL